MSQPLSPEAIKATMEGKLGPYGCLCQDWAHYMLGDGCEICNPRMVERYKWEEE